jgi:5-keto 4-deoxyuronate isomerase
MSNKIFLQDTVDKKKNNNRFSVSPVEERTMGGIVFASKKEMKRYAELRLLERAGEISDLELQPEFRVSINGQHYCTYTADFAYTEKGGRVIEELKSTGTAKDAAFRLRKKAAELYYGIKVKVIIK